MQIVKCKFNFEECEKRIKDQINKIGATIFCEIDHKKNLEAFGLKLDKSKVIFFGNPKVGGLLMQKKIEISYDLPMRVAIWEKEGEVFVGYRMPSEIAKEYNIEADVIKKMDEAVLSIIEVIKG